MVDLCSVDDVKRESQGKITSDNLPELREDIEYKISDLSDKLLAWDSSLTSENRDARLCVAYGVLAWLEQGELIDSDDDITSFRDGDLSISFDNGPDSPKSNCEKYKELLLKFKPTFKFGANITHH